jgi:hypothetical protein
MNIKEVLISAPPIMVPILRKHHAFTASYIKRAYGLDVYPLEWLYTESNKVWWIVINNITMDIIWQNNAVWRAEVYKGLHTDLASCPDALQSFVATSDERFFIPPIAHDVAYQTKDLDRNDSDMMLSELAEYYNYKGLRNFFASFGVTVGGGKHYNQFRDRDKKRCGRITKLGFLQEDGSIRL